ncbi:hypothetical protein BH23GEM9_BH23GEM9_25280 [soil metagenome]
MNKTVLLTVGLCLTLVSVADAQMRRPEPRTWVSAFGLMYTGLARFHDPGSDSDWVFGDNAFGLGLAVQRAVGDGLLLGIEGSLARPAYERRIAGTAVVVPGATGTANVVTGMATGRFAYGGGSDLGFYLTGGLGTIAYHLEDLGEWNTDFALRAGTGLEYRISPGRAMFLEWGRIWGYHESDGVGGGSAQHGMLKLGYRVGR